MASKNDTRKRVVRSFFERKTDSAGAFRAHNEMLYSYELPLAWLDVQGRAQPLPGIEKKSSPTTAEHQHMARMAVDVPEWFGAPRAFVNGRGELETIKAH